MTNTNRLTAATVTATILALQLLIAGSRLAAAENKDHPAPQSPSPKQLEKVAKWFEDMLDWSSFPSSKQIDEITSLQKQTWQLEIYLDMPSLDPQAVQFAIVDKDPALDYTDQLKRMRTANRQQLETADSERWKELMRAVQMKVDWDNGFTNVTGANLDLLTNSSHNNSSGIVASSNGPAGKKWVVTKCVDIDQRPYCWSIPVQVNIGKRVSVTLNKNDTFDLQTPYEAAMNEPIRDGDNPAPKK